MTTNTYAVYTTTPSGKSFRTAYDGNDIVEALKAYDKLERANKPRNLTEREQKEWGGYFPRVIMGGGGFPLD